MNQKFCNILVHAGLRRLYTRPQAVQAVTGTRCNCLNSTKNNAVVGAMTRCSLFHAVCDLKFVQMNVKHSLNRELLIYEFKLGYKPMETNKNICCAKDERAT